MMKNDKRKKKMKKFLLRAMELLRDYLQVETVAINNKFLSVSNIICT